jgi:hypothetical protein
MTSLLSLDADEDRLRRPLTEAELAAMPVSVADNRRFACCDCGYVSVDEAMLLYHLTALHPAVKEYTCPHCTNVKVGVGGFKRYPKAGKKTEPNV